MANRIESEPAKIDQALFKQLYNSAILKIPDKLRREGMKKRNPNYNKVLKTSIQLFLSHNGLMRNIMEEPRGDAEILFINIFNRLKVPEETLPKTVNMNASVGSKQEDLFEAI